MSRALVFTQQAQTDLEALFWHIAADDPQSALRYTEDIRMACEPLVICRSWHLVGMT